MSNLGKWSRWYEGMTDPQAYGDARSYHVAEELLGGMEVEDWGCGKGWFRTVHQGGYVGVDGTASKFADVVADLADYESSCQAVLLRHVLEHNYDWQPILENALASAEERVVVVLFTPLRKRGFGWAEIAYTDDVGVPDISFDLAELEVVAEAKGWLVTDEQRFDSATQYGSEVVLTIEPA